MGKPIRSHQSLGAFTSTLFFFLRSIYPHILAKTPYRMSPHSIEAPGWARIWCPWIAVYSKSRFVGRFHPVPLFQLRHDRVTLLSDVKSTASSCPGKEQPHHTRHTARKIDVYYRGVIVGQFHPEETSMTSGLPTKLSWDAEAEALVLPRQRHANNARHNAHTYKVDRLESAERLSFYEKLVLDTDIGKEGIISWLERLEESDDIQGYSSDNADCASFEPENKD